MQLVLIIGLVLSFAAEGTSKVARTTLRQLTAESDLIVVGAVTHTQSVKGVRVAEVEVIETLKGRPYKRLYYLAQPTWTCDITSGTVGETAMFFFKEYEFDSQPGSMAFVSAVRRGVYWVTNGAITVGDYKEPPGFREEVSRLVGSSPFLTVYWSGRGQMPIREVGGVKYVTIWVGDVILPAGVETIDGPEPEFASFIRSVRLSRVAELVKQQAH